MKKSIKAPLISALVLPGAGHFFLKRYLSAACLVFVSTLALYFLISTAMESASIISNKILNGEIQLDSVAIASEIRKQTEAGKSVYSKHAATVLMLAWLISIVDSFRIGRLQDKALKKE